MERKLFYILEDKYGQKYSVIQCTGWGVNCIKIDNEFFGIIFSENIKNKDEIMVKTFNNTFCYYNEIESLVKGVTRIIKKSLSDKNDK